MVGARLLVRVSPPDLPRIDQVGIDITVLMFVTVVDAARRHRLWRRAGAAGRHGRESRRCHSGETAFDGQRGRSALVVAEVALSLVLLAGAGLMIRSFVKVQNLDLGFQAENVLTAQIFSAGQSLVDPGQFRPLPPGVTPQLSKPAAFYAQLMEPLKATPGVESIGAVSSLPLNPVGIDYDLPVIVKGGPRPRVGRGAAGGFPDRDT